MNHEVVQDVAAFLGIPAEELLERHDNYLQYQLTRWRRLAPDSASALAEYYKDNLYLYELISTPSFGVVRLVAPFLRQGSTILDYGSGIGTHGLHFLRRGHPVTFVDLPSPHFDYIRWHCSRAGLAACFVEKSAADSLPEDSFDAIFCFDVLEHVFEWREALRHFSRLLKADGKLFLIVSFREFEDNAIHISSHTGLTEDTFQACMKQYGLVEIFHRDRPVPTTHPLEPFRVFARAPSESALRASKLFEDGDAALRNNSLANAERCFAELTEWNPQDFSAHRGLARIFLSQGKLDEATAATDKVLELLPGDIGALELKADLRKASGDRIGAARGYVEAIGSWGEHAAQSKKNLASLLKEGLSFEFASDHIDDWRKLQSLLGYLIEFRNFGPAEGLARRLTAAHAQDSYAGYLVWKEYAWLLRETGRSAEAIGVLEQLISRHPDRLWLHFDMALCHASQGKFSEAMSELDKEERCSPFRATILFEKGLVCRRQGDLARARDLFGEVVNLAPDNGPAFRERASVALQLGDRALARSDLQQVIALQPDNAQAHFELGQLELLSRHYWKAIENFDAAYRLDPERMWPKFSRNMKMILTARGLTLRLWQKVLTAT